MLRMLSMKKVSISPLATILILGTFSIPFVILFYTLYWAWDSQIEGKDYIAAFEKDGKLYEFGNINARSLAFDRGTSDDQLYLNNPNELAELIAISFKDYNIEKTDNPFFAGKIRVSNWGNYLNTEQKYSSPKEFSTIYTFFDKNGKQIFTYQPETDNEFVTKLRPTFPMFSKRKYNIGAKRDYLNLTKILKAKLNQTLKIRANDTNKLLILSFED